MAQKVRTLFIDDLDGTPAEGTVRFALDGTAYEIDLTAEHAQVLRNTLARYVAAARRSPANPRPARTRRAAGSSPVSSSEVRAWAKSQGMEVKKRGRIPAGLVVKFKAATETDLRPAATRKIALRGTSAPARGGQSTAKE